MPAAAGARALLSATTATATTTRPVPPAHLVRLTARRPPRLQRGFHSSLPSRNRPPGGPKSSAAPPSIPTSDDNGDPKDRDARDATAKTDQPTEAPARTTASPSDPAPPSSVPVPGPLPVDAEARREILKSAGYGSARARASRNNRFEEAPPLEVPTWFKAFYLTQWEELFRRSDDNVNLQLNDQTRQYLLDQAERLFNDEALTDASVEEMKEHMNRFLANGPRLKDPWCDLMGSIRLAHEGAFWQTVLLTYDPAAEPEHLDVLRRHYRDRLKERPVWWPEYNSKIPKEAQRWISNVLFDCRLEHKPIRISPISQRPDPEYASCIELLSAVQAQLATPPPPLSDSRGARRPPIVLTMLNGKGHFVAESIIDDVATHVRADVVHLNAHVIARLIGRHVGQNPWSSRGPLAMLGYSAAEMNGRLAPRQEATDPEQMGPGVVAIEVASRLRTFLASRESLSAAGPDGRWDDLKISAALETLVSAVSRQRDETIQEMTRDAANLLDPEAAEAAIQAAQALHSPHDLIIHLHDYVEISALYPAIITKLRNLADRLWKPSRKVVLVGTSGGNPETAQQWRDQVIDLGRDGAHIIPFHLADTNPLEYYSNVKENVANIEEMVRSMVGDGVEISFHDVNKLTRPPENSELARMLRHQVMDAQWVARVASAIVGRSRGARPEGFGLTDLEYAIKFVIDRDKRWQDIVPRVTYPYWSPIHVPPRNSGSPSENDPIINRLPDAAAKQDYTNEEKKLLSGLINAKDIHTTFDDIVVPQETKDSLIGLTTLSLVRPDAFSYGVLKMEQINGCMLYGPPGTGKTLLAKAVAKESGANMLEVSAADIYDKYVGQSEKNVQALFSLARKLSPCVVFLDEADALLCARRSASGRVAHRETITQFLREWDGLVRTRAFIMVATNRPFDLDEAVLRRLPRKILVDLPLPAEREKILRVMLRDEQLADDVNLTEIAGAPTDLYSGSDLKNLCVSAAMEAVRDEMRARDAWLAEREKRRAGKSAPVPEQQQQPESKAKAEEEDLDEKAQFARESTATAVPGDEETTASLKIQEEAEAQKQVEEEEEEYRFPERRLLTRAHFDKALRDISASISGDMESLKALRKFDEQYGDAGRKKNARRAIGFLDAHHLGGRAVDGTGEARIRKP
ncbi:hypothetical protein VTJ04DRAFT_9105 [Mycothermus thermophilus]|uniref:uncharacterized protein n=1 Tax=Humicola insolens TaxID=85995 RepID=UPI0037447F0D